MSCDHSGSAGATVSAEADGGVGVQLAVKSSAAVAVAAQRNLRIWEAPKGGWTEAGSVQRPMLQISCGNCGKWGHS